MEIGLVGGVRQRPVALVASGRGGDDAEAEAGGTVRQQRGGDFSAEQQRVAVDPAGDARRARRLPALVAQAIAGEVVDRPLAGRREVEFAVGRACGRGDEGFAAGLLP